MGNIKLKKNIGERMMIGIYIVFLDLRKTFELLNRNILIQKMGWYRLKRMVFN